MKKIVVIVFCLVYALSLVGCGNKMDKDTAFDASSELQGKSRDGVYYCEHCGSEASDVKEAEDGYYCYDCILEYECEKCRECGVYYENDGFDCNEEYCHTCFDDKGKTCFLCWQSFGEMVSLEINGEKYFICPDCATDYFTNIEPIMPVDYCVECGHLYALGDYYYEHYIYDGASICQECLIKNS